jgi:hypothetical protein
MRVRDLNFVGIAIVELEVNPPRAIDVDRPKVAKGAFELMQSNALKLASAINAACRVGQDCNEIEEYQKPHAD